MRKPLSIALIWLILSLLTFNAPAQEPLKLAYPDFNYEPFAWTDENGQGAGIFADIFREMLGKRLQTPYTFESLPWKRAQMYIANGGRDGAMMPATTERDGYARHTAEPAVVMTMKLYTKAGSPRIEALKKVRRVEDLRPFQLVDHLGNGWAEQNLAGMDVHWTTNLDAVLMQLASGRGDVFVHTSQVVNAKLKKLGLTDQVVEVSDVVIESIPFYFYVSRESAYLDMLPKFDQTLKAMREDGTLQAIYARHGLDLAR